MIHDFAAGYMTGFCSCLIFFLTLARASRRR